MPGVPMHRMFDGAKFGRALTCYAGKRTLRQLANATGVSFNTLRRARLGQTVSVDVFMRLCLLMGTPMELFILAANAERAKKGAE